MAPSWLIRVSSSTFAGKDAILAKLAGCESGASSDQPCCQTVKPTETKPRKGKRFLMTLLPHLNAVILFYFSVIWANSLLQFPVTCNQETYFIYLVSNLTYYEWLMGKF